VADYLVLQSIDPNATGDWREYARREANSGEQAIRQVLAQHPVDKGAFVAVPARSWKPVTVRTETTTVIRLDTPTPEA
jgi:hypothetical protein